MIMKLSITANKAKTYEALKDIITSYNRTYFEYKWLCGIKSLSEK